MFHSQNEAAMSHVLLNPQSVSEQGPVVKQQSRLRHARRQQGSLACLRALYRSDQTVRARMNADMKALLAGKALKINPETLGHGVRREVYASAVRAMVETHLERFDSAHLRACVNALALGLPLPDTQGTRLAARKVYAQVARGRVRRHFGLDSVDHLDHGRVVDAEEFQGIAKRYGADAAQFRFRTHATYQAGITRSQADALDGLHRNLYGSLEALEARASDEEPLDTSRDRLDGGHSDPDAVKATRPADWGYLYDDGIPFERVRMWSQDATTSVADTLPAPKEGLKKLGFREGALALTYLALALTGARWVQLSKAAVRNLSRRFTRSALTPLRQQKVREQTARQRSRRAFVERARRDGSFYFRARKKAAMKLLRIVTSYPFRGTLMQRYLSGQLTYLLILRYAEQVARKRWKSRHQPRSVARGTALLLRNQRVDKPKDNPNYGPELPYAVRALRDHFVQKNVSAQPVRLASSYGLAVAPSDGGLIAVLDGSDIRKGRRHLRVADSFCIVDREESLAFFLLPEDFDALSSRESQPAQHVMLEYGASVTQIDRPAYRYPVSGVMRDVLERLTQEEPIDRSHYRVIDLSKHRELSDYRFKPADPPYMATKPAEAARAQQIREHLYWRFELAGYSPKHSNSVNIEAVYTVVDEVVAELGGVLSLKDLGALIGEIGYLNKKGQFRFRINPLVRQFAAHARPKKLRLQEQELREHALTDVPQSDLELAKEALQGMSKDDPRYEDLLADYTFLQERHARFSQMIEQAHQRKRLLDQAFSDHLAACKARVEKVVNGNAPRGAVAALAQARLLAAGL